MRWSYFCLSSSLACIGTRSTLGYDSRCSLLNGDTVGRRSSLLGGDCPKCVAYVGSKGSQLGGDSPTSVDRVTGDYLLSRGGLLGDTTPVFSIRSGSQSIPETYGGVLDGFGCAESDPGLVDNNPPVHMQSVMSQEQIRMQQTGGENEPRQDSCALGIIPSSPLSFLPVAESNSPLPVSLLARPRHGLVVKI